MESARRKTTGSNTGWIVTIRPSGPGDIAIRLPARSCGEANAVCFDNRPLAGDRRQFLDDLDARGQSVRSEVASVCRTAWRLD